MPQIPATFSTYIIINSPLNFKQGKNFLLFSRENFLLFSGENFLRKKFSPTPPSKNELTLKYFIGIQESLSLLPVFFWMSGNSFLSDQEFKNNKVSLKPFQRLAGSRGAGVRWTPLPQGEAPTEPTGETQRPLESRGEPFSFPTNDYCTVGKMMV